MDLAQLPTAKQTQAQMLGLIDAVQREISRIVPATRPWRWHREWMTTTCDDTDAVGLLFPKLASSHGLSDTEWAQIFPAATRLAAAAGLTDVNGIQNRIGNHDVRIASTDGRVLSLGSREATVISATVGCRLRLGESLWIGDEIPMPPDPLP
jgi:hypothetical protein